MIPEAGRRKTSSRPDRFHRSVCLLFVFLLILVPLAFRSVGISIEAEQLSGKAVIAEFQWTKAFLVNLFCCLLILLAAPRFLKKRSFEVRLSPSTLLPAMLFLATTCLSLLQSRNVHQSFEIFLLLVGPLLAYAMLLLTLRDASPVRPFFGASFVAALAVSLFGILQYFQIAYLPQTRYGNPTPGSFLGLANFATEFLLIPFSFSVGLLATEPKGKSIYAVGLAIIAFYFVIAEVRASWLAVTAEFVLGVVLFSLFARRIPSLRPQKKGIIRLALISLLLAAGIAFTHFGHHLAKRAASLFDAQEPSRRVRLLAWKMAGAMVRDHPLFGIGLGNTELLAPRYAPPELEAMYLASNTKIDHVHNDYLEILVECGLIGFSAFALFLFSLLRLAIHSLAEAQDRRRFWLRLALITGIAGLLMNGFFSFPLRNPASALYFWVAAALLEQETVRPSRQTAGGAVKRVLFLPRWCSALLLLILAAGSGALAYFSARLSKAELNLNVAATFLQLKQWAEARASSSEAIRLHPTDYGAYYVRALASSNEKDFRSAVKDLQKCLALAPDLERAHVALAFAHYDQGDLPRARDEFLLAAPMMRSKRKEILAALVSVYLRLQEPNKAAEAAEEAVRLDPQNPEYRYKLAYAYASGKRYPQAAEACRTALALKPDFPSARTLLEQVTKVPKSPQSRQSPPPAASPSGPPTH